MTRRIREEEWLPEGVELTPSEVKSRAELLLTCKGCGEPIDLHCLFVREGVCAECEWGGA